MHLGSAPGIYHLAAITKACWHLTVKVVCLDRLQINRPNGSHSIFPDLSRFSGMHIRSSSGIYHLAAITEVIYSAAGVKPLIHYLNLELSKAAYS